MESLLLRKITEERGGYPTWWLFRIGIYGIVTLILPLLIIILVNSWIIRIIIAFISMVFILVFYIHLRTPEKYLYTSRKIQYILKVRRGETIISKYSAPISFLKQLFQIEKAHPNGIIEFTHNRYGVIFRLFVPNEPDGGVEAFISLVTANFVNRIMERQTIKVNAINRHVQSLKVLDEIIQSMNDSSKSPEQVQHLESIYKQLNDSIKVPTQRFIYMFIGLGFFENINDAEAELRNILPSLQDGFAITGIDGVRVVDMNELALVYRRCIS